jgi:hypothetical protein
LSGFEGRRCFRCFLWCRPAIRASFRGVLVVTRARCRRLGARAVLRGDPEVVVRLVGIVAVAVTVVVSGDVVVVGGAGSVVVVVDVDEVVVVGPLVVVVSVVAGGESARAAAATPVAKRTATPRPANSLFSGGM